MFTSTLTPVFHQTISPPEPLNLLRVLCPSVIKTVSPRILPLKDDYSASRITTCEPTFGIAWHCRQTEDFADISKNSIQSAP